MHSPPGWPAVLEGGAEVVRLSADPGVPGPDPKAALSAEGSYTYPY